MRSAIDLWQRRGGSAGVTAATSSEGRCFGNDGAVGEVSVGALRVLPLGAFPSRQSTSAEASRR